MSLETLEHDASRALTKRKQQERNAHDETGNGNQPCPQRAARRTRTRGEIVITVEKADESSVLPAERDGGDGDQQQSDQSEAAGGVHQRTFRRTAA
jgi:hypothetical protein